MNEVEKYSKKIEEKFAEKWKEHLPLFHCKRVLVEFEETAKNAIWLGLDCENLPDDLPFVMKDPVSLQKVGPMHLQEYLNPISPEQFWLLEAQLSSPLQPC